MCFYNVENDLLKNVLLDVYQKESARLSNKFTDVSLCFDLF